MLEKQHISVLRVKRLMLEKQHLGVRSCPFPVFVCLRAALPCSIHAIAMRPFRLLVFAFLAVSASAENIVFPPDAVCDVRQPPYNAKGDGETDDTAAIQKALDERQRLIYLPNGTYLVSNTLRWGTGQKHQVLQGQSVDGTVIKLQDNCGGFSIPERPLAVLWTGKAPGQRFRNGLRNLTIDTGKGNAGAIGAQFMANEQGTIDTVHIRCGESGPLGLDLGYTAEQGPCLLTHVRVTGFDVGIETKGVANSITAEDIALDGQKTAGWRNDGQPVFIRNLRTTGGASAFLNVAGTSEPVTKATRTRAANLAAASEGAAVLLDCTFTGSGDAKDHAAIVNSGKSALFVRNLKTSGFETAVKNDSGTKESPVGAEVAEWSSHPPVHAWEEASANSLGLEIKDTPDVPWDELTDWVNVADFSPTKGLAPGKRVRTRGGADWTSAIQQAIDSGKSTIYFPREGCVFTGTVHVRGKARRFVGCEGTFSKRSTGIFEIDAGEAPIVVFERFDWSSSPVTVHINSNRILVAKNTAGGDWQIGKEAGEVYFSDVCTNKIRIDSAHVWARQLTLEGAADAGIVNDSGTLRILGLKTTGDGTQITSQNGARTEILGAFVSPGGAKDKPACFNVTDSAFGLLGFAEAVVRGKPFRDLVSETRRGETKTLRRGDTPARAGGSLVMQYSGFTGK